MVAEKMTHNVTHNVTTKRERCLGDFGHGAIDRVVGHVVGICGSCFWGVMTHAKTGGQRGLERCVGLVGHQFIVS